MKSLEAVYLCFLIVRQPPIPRKSLPDYLAVLKGQLRSRPHSKAPSAPDAGGQRSSELHDRTLTRHTEVRLDKVPNLCWGYQGKPLIDLYLREIGQICPEKR